MSDESGGQPAFAAAGLDELLGELRLRAGAARAAHDRTRALLDAVVSVTADLDLSAVLHRIVVAACTLADARYGALGVIGSDRGLIAFVTHGMTDEQRLAIGDLPRGHGLLGVLIDEPWAVRLPDIARHPKSYGFPPGHPPMHSFLGVPVRASGAAYGNLYLSEKQGAAEFTSEDEDVVVGLAAAAGAAIERARLYADSERRQHWLAATGEISAALLSRARRIDVLALVARLARQTAEAEMAAVLLGSDEELVVEVADGAGAQDLVDRPVPVSGALADVMDSHTPVVTSEVPFGADNLGRVLIVPLRPDPDTRGALVVGWSIQDRRAVGEQDVRMVAAFAEQAALALELARGQADRARLAVYEDRDRIARDLHDSVVQRLFAVGLSLRGLTRGSLEADEATRRTERAVDDLDTTVKEIRRTIFRLHRRPGEGDLEADLEAVAAAAESTLSFAPELSVAGATRLVPASIAEHVLAVVREALANVARHAQATAVRVDVEVGERELSVVVSDDGMGIGPIERRSGLANMAKRANLVDGTFEVVARSGGGTRLTWTAPLDR